MEDQADKPDKLDAKDRAAYLKAKGYDVTLKVTYTRMRRIRALTKAQAKEFAKAREEKFSQRYFNAQNLRDFSVDSVKTTKVVEVIRDDEEGGSVVE